MTHVLDASAILALLLDEPGSDFVHRAGPDAIVSAVNLSEVIAKMLDRGSHLALILERLAKFDFRVISFDQVYSQKAAALRDLTRDRNISFADRACLALGLETGLPIFTGDKEWADLDLKADIRLIR